MRVNLPANPMPVTKAAPELAPMPARSLGTEAAQERQRQDRVTAAVAVSSTALAFDFSLGGNALTVTLSDRTSGEVFRRLVYDHAGTLEPAAQASRGQLVDIAT